MTCHAKEGEIILLKATHKVFVVTIHLVVSLVSDIFHLLLEEKYASTH